jgi:hypothetical protein
MRLSCCVCIVQKIRNVANAHDAELITKHKPSPYHSPTCYPVILPSSHWTSSEGFPHKNYLNVSCLVPSVSPAHPFLQDFTALIIHANLLKTCTNGSDTFWVFCFQTPVVYVQFRNSEDHVPHPHRTGKTGILFLRIVNREDNKTKHIFSQGTDIRRHYYAEVAQCTRHEMTGS